MTNIEFIHAMDTEELAKWLLEVRCHHCTIDARNCDMTTKLEDCLKGVCAWLNAER
jgi:hypothetical protein